MLPRSYNRRADPDNPTGAPLDVLFDIVLPEATTNLFLNPSWETNTSNWTNSNDGSGGTPYARATTHQFKGAYSAALTIRTGGTFGQIVNASVSNATQYALSFYVRRSNGGLVRAANCKAFINGAVTDWDTITYSANGWYRVEKVFTSTSTSGVGIRVIGSPGQVFYVDAAQLEAKGYCTTYCDGDQKGLLPIETPTPFYWTGTPHASTSVRSAATRAGGRPMNVTRYGLTILALIGLGFSQRSVISTPLGLADGSLYQRTIRESREFTIAASFEPSDPRTLSARRGMLRSALSHDLSGSDQPVVLRMQRYDGLEPIGDQVTLPVSYTDGLGEEMAQPFDEKVSMQFRQYLPALQRASDGGTTLGVQTSVSNANRIIQRGANGTWAAFGTGMNGQVFDIAIGPDGFLYAAGSFSTANGVTVNGITYWNGTTWVSLAGGVSGGSQVNKIVFGPDGTLYAGGTFTTIGGVAANRIAKWNGSAWSALGTGLDNVATALTIGADGALYVGGDFFNAGGVVATSIAKWNGSAWSALGSGITGGAVNALTVGLDGTLYAGGRFTAAGGIGMIGLAKWNGSAWSSMGNLVKGSGTPEAFSLAIDPTGMVYVGGIFDSVGGVTTANIAKWNGSSWSAMGSGANNTVRALRIVPQGVIAGGQFTTINGISLPDSLALWNGSTWTLLDSDLPGTAQVNTIARYPDGTLVFGYDTSGTATVASVTNVTYPGTVPGGITVTITGPSSGTGRVYSVINNTTGKAIYLNLTLSAGEIAYLTVANGTIDLRTSFAGAVPSAIIPGSDSDFALIKGANALSYLTSSGTMTAVLSFTPQFESLDDATRAPALQ